MKLVAMERPKCRAPLEVNPALTHAACNYCGYRFIPDDEAKHVKIHIENPHQTGYEFE